MRKHTPARPSRFLTTSDRNKDLLLLHPRSPRPVDPPRDSPPPHVCESPFSLVHAQTDTPAVEKFRGIGDAHFHDLRTYLPTYPSASTHPERKVPTLCACIVSTAASPTRGSLANDLRDGQRTVGNKNNRKRKERAWPTRSEHSLHNFIGRAGDIVAEINKVNEVAGWNVFPRRCALCILASVRSRSSSLLQLQLYG